MVVGQVVVCGQVAVVAVSKEETREARECENNKNIYTEAHCLATTSPWPHQSGCTHIPAHPSSSLLSPPSPFGA
jgi:hypothetical protein